LCARYVSGLTFIRYAHIQKIRNQKSLGASKFKEPTQDSRNLPWLPMSQGDCYSFNKST